jgi:nucleoside-diphosphate-sugar epimerase
VDNEVRGILAPYQSDITGPVNIGNPAEVTMLELAEQVLRVTGSASPVTFEPLPVSDPVRWRPDITLALTLLGWQPEVELADGLRRTARWLAAKLGRLRPVA